MVKNEGCWTYIQNKNGIQGTYSEFDAKKSHLKDINGSAKIIKHNFWKRSKNSIFRRGRGSSITQEISRSWTWKKRGKLEFSWVFGPINKKDQNNS